MSRPDQSVTFLRSYGYSIYRFPRATAQPLDLMHRDGKDLTRLGLVTDLIAPGAVALPQVGRDERPGIDIEGKETSKVNAAIGLSILSSFVGALGGGNVGLQIAFNRTRTVTFQYTAVTEDQVDVLGLEKFVKAGSISPHVPSGTLEKLLDDEVYVITSVLKTKKIVVESHGEAGTSMKLDVPVIQAAVGGSLKVDSESGLSSRVAFEGALPIAFAFQAVQLVFDESGEFLTTEQLAPGDAAARAVPTATAARRGGRQPVFLASRGVFMRVHS